MNACEKINYLTPQIAHSDLIGNKSGLLANKSYLLDFFVVLFYLALETDFHLHLNALVFSVTIGMKDNFPSIDTYSGNVTNPPLISIYLIQSYQTK